MRCAVSHPAVLTAVVVAFAGERTALPMLLNDSSALDGTYDPSAELVAEGPAAAAFGEDLFDSVWRDATLFEDVATVRSV